MATKKKSTETDIAAVTAAPVKKVALMPVVKKVAVKAPVLPKLTKAEIAAAKQEKEDMNDVMHRTTSVIVPLWFGQKAVEKTINKPLELRPETALCLMFIGARGAAGCSRVGIEINLRPSGFDRGEARLFADMGCSSLIGGKFAKFAKKRKLGDPEEQLATLVLTAKGQKIFDLAKRCMLDKRTGTYMV
jgi:hypothetical protein